MNNSKLIHILFATGLLISGLPSQASTPETLREYSHKPLMAEKEWKQAIKVAGTGSYKTVLTGFLYYAESWNNLPSGVNTPNGIYTFPTDGSDPEPLARISYMNSLCNGGAVLAGDTYWYIWRQKDPTGATSIDISQLYSYNLRTGEFNSMGTVPSDFASSSDKAWDPVENKIYGQHVIDGTRKLCIENYEDLTVTPVGTCAQYYGLAFNAEGQLYGIDGSGNLCLVDKTTAAATTVGNTGVIPKMSQSMTFDYKTGDLWWASYSAAGSGYASVIYKVDPATAKAVAVKTFNDQEEILGLGVMPPLAADDAPGYAENITVTPEATASKEATVTFTLPTETYLGKTLTGEISWILTANGNKLAEGKGNGGDKVTEIVTLPEGDVKVAVVCSNTIGAGPAGSVSVWIGQDYPLPPSEIALSINEKSGKFSLTWESPVAGEHGGYIDSANLTYTVTRMPDKIEAVSGLKECAFEETLDIPELPKEYWYEVKALNGWRESEPGVSNHVSFGKGFEVPYHNSFDTAASLGLFYTVDGNRDGKCWEWNSHGSQSAYIFSGTNAEGNQDDWLITPGIDMKAGSTYSIVYTIPANINDGRFMDRLEVGAGNGLDPKSYKIIQAPFDCDGKESHQKVTFTPEADGYYHIGFHCISDSKRGLSIAIDDLHIDAEASQEAPAAVTSLNLRASRGTAPVTISFVTPTKTVGGKKLESISRVDVFRNTSELVKSVEVTETGRRITVTDNKGAKGFTKYTVVAYNEHGVGARAEETIFLGIDYPGAPSAINLRDMGNGSLELSWKAPDKGANGGWIDTENLSYKVYSIVNGFATDPQETTETRFVIPNHPDYSSDTQKLIYYAVAAVNKAGEGNAYRSGEIIVGTPYKYPFAESWTRGEAENEMWYRMNYADAGWETVTDMDADGDGGSLAFQSSQNGDMSYYCMGKVDLKLAAKPKLIFNYYAIPGENIRIVAEAAKAFHDGYFQCCEIDFSALKGEAGWREAIVDLSPLATSYPHTAIRFLGVSSGISPVRIDNVRIEDSDKIPTFSGISDVFTDGIAEDDEIYTLTGIRLTDPAPGTICIIRHKDGTVTKQIIK